MPQKRERTDANPLAMVLCDAISLDEHSGKVHLHGLFSILFATEVPVRSSFAAYASISEAGDNVTAHFRVVGPSGNHVGQSLLTKMNPPTDPLLETVIYAQLSDIEFPEYGYYFVQLWVKGRYIIERRLLVMDLGEQK